MTTPNDQQERKFKHPIPEESREHYKRAREEMRQAIETLLPEGFMDHRRAARREMLLAWRGLIDAAIQRTDEKS